MALDITLEKFRTLYPEFDDPNATDAEVDYALELGQEIHGCSANAIYALAAHILALASIEGTGGDDPATSAVTQIKKTRVGRIATEYVTLSSKKVEDGYYETTPYGKMFLALKNAALKRLSTRVA